MSYPETHEHIIKITPSNKNYNTAHILNQKEILWKASNGCGPQVRVNNEATPNAMIRTSVVISSDVFSDDLNVLFYNRVKSRAVLGMHCSDKKIYARKASIVNV